MKKNQKINLLGALCLALTLFVSSCTKDDSIAPDNSGSVNQTSEKFIPLPIVPANLVVPAGNTVRFHWYAQGIQIYKCLPDPNIVGAYLWTFQAPQATLYNCPNFITVTGSHYAGPTWDNNHGSTIVGVKLQGAASPDPNAIPWLLLQGVSHTGHAAISTVTYIQRVNTSGGKAPATGNDAAHANQVVNIPYTAEYYFYVPI